MHRSVAVQLTQFTTNYIWRYESFCSSLTLLISDLLDLIIHSLEFVWSSFDHFLIKIIPYTYLPRWDEDIFHNILAFQTRLSFRLVKSSKYLVRHNQVFLIHSSKGVRQSRLSAQFPRLWDYSYWVFLNMHDRVRAPCKCFVFCRRPVCYVMFRHKVFIVKVRKDSCVILLSCIHCYCYAVPVHLWWYVRCDVYFKIVLCVWYLCSFSTSGIALSLVFSPFPFSMTLLFAYPVWKELQ